MIAAEHIAQLVGEAIPRIAVELRPDVLEALYAALERESSPRGRSVLRQLIDNADLASAQCAPLCQDTGTVWVRVELGAEDCVDGDLQAAVDSAVRDAYCSAGLRMSVARDGLLDRGNTGDNTPAFIDLVQRPGRGATVSVMLKGGGSDNASRVGMLAPSDGAEGVKRFVLETVEANGRSACPPLVIGVGVGSTFDKVGSLAKRALLDPLGSTASDPRVGAFEAELLTAINATGIGPGGLGGDTTALGVRVISAPCHIAALPVAVNVGCSAIRTFTAEVSAS